MPSTEWLQNHLDTSYLTADTALHSIAQHRFRLAIKSLRSGSTSSNKITLNSSGGDNLPADGNKDNEEKIESEEEDQSESEEEKDDDDDEEEDNEDDKEENRDEEDDEVKEEHQSTFYAKFLDHFMPAIKGERMWKRVRRGCCSHQNVVFDLNEHATISDEAFLLVCLENYSVVWEYQFKQKYYSVIQEAEGSNTDSMNEEEDEEVSVRDIDKESDVSHMC